MCCQSFFFACQINFEQVFSFCCYSHIDLFNSLPIFLFVNEHKHCLSLYLCLTMQVVLRKTASLTSLLPFLMKNVVIFPSRAVAIENALRLFSPRLAIVDEHLTRHLPRQWLTSLNIDVSASLYTIVHFNLFFLKYKQFIF